MNEINLQTTDEELKNDIEFGFNKPLSIGLSFLLRVKNEGDYLKNNINSIIDIADEIIIVDNQSTDNSHQLYKEWLNNPKIKIFYYNLEINNTTFKNELVSFYNWGLSKVSKTNVIKWDGDFIAIKENLKNMVDFYELKTRNDKFAIWFSGLTFFHQKYLNISSYYDEFRVFSKLNGFKWTKYKEWETTDEYLTFTENKMISISGNKNIFNKNYLGEQSKEFDFFRKPIFYEHKTLNDFKQKKIIDNRCSFDNQLILKYHKSLFNQNINEELLIILSHTGSVCGVGTYLYNIQNALNFYLTEKNYLFINSFEKLKSILEENKNKNIKLLINNFVIKEDELINIKNIYQIKLFAITHSDLSYYNNFYVNNFVLFEKIFVLNQITYNKLTEFGLGNVFILKNYLPYLYIPENRVFNNKSVKLLYFSRSSNEKNLPMLLNAFEQFNITEEFKIELNLYTELNDDLKNQIIYNKNKDFINYHSFTNDKTIYLENDICILPSVNEGCSYNILEAINFKIPILTTNFLANKEIIQNYLPYLDLGKLDIEEHYLANYNILLEKIGYQINDNNKLSFNTELFEINSKEIFNKINLIINNYDFYKQKVKELKENIKDIYFNPKRFIIEFNNAIFDNIKIVDEPIINYKPKNNKIILYDFNYKHEIIQYLEKNNIKNCYLTNINNLKDFDIPIICEYFNLYEIDHKNYLEKKEYFELIEYSKDEVGLEKYLYLEEFERFTLKNNFKIIKNLLNISYTNQLCLPHQFSSDLVDSIFYFHKNELYLIFEIFKKMDNPKYKDFYSYLNYIKEYYEKQNDFTYIINNEYQFIDNFIVYLKQINNKVEKGYSINLFNKNIKKKEISLNLIIYKYFNYDLREKRLINILKKICNITNIKIIEYNLNDYEEEILNKINEVIQENENNLILNIDTIIFEKFYLELENLILKLDINKTIEIGKKNYLSNKKLDLNKNYCFINLTSLQTGLISSENNDYNLLENYFDYYDYGLSFIVRYYNEIDYLKLIIPKLKEIKLKNYEVILINNNSNDGSGIWCIENTKDLKNFYNVSYPIKNCRAGDENLEGITNNKNNLLPYFYNWCFSQSNMSYCIKWDADMIATSQFYNLINLIDFNLQNRCYLNRGNTLYFKKENEYLDKDSSSNEYRIFYRNLFFVKSMRCENYLFNFHKKVNTDVSIFNELKDIEKDLFKNRSSMIDKRDVKIWKIKKLIENK